MRETIITTMTSRCTCPLTQTANPTSTLMTASLAELITFNAQHAAREMPFFAQEIFEQANAKGPLTDAAYIAAHTSGFDALRDRVRAAGFSAFVEQVRTDKGTLSRVRVGPVADRADADRLRAQVAAKLGVSGIVRPHP